MLGTMVAMHVPGICLLIVIIRNLRNVDPPSWGNGPNGGSGAPPEPRPAPWRWSSRPRPAKQRPPLRVQARVTR
jgi:hypothetical protein